MKIKIDKKQLSCITMAVVVIALIIYMIYNDNNTTAKHMNGLWVTTDVFNKDSDIDGIMLYITDRNGYIIVGGSGQVIENTVVDLTIAKKMMSEKKIDPDEKQYSITIENFKMMPKNMTMNFIPTKGRMILQKDGMIYADFIKDNSFTSL